MSGMSFRFGAVGPSGAKFETLVREIDRVISCTWLKRRLVRGLLPHSLAPWVTSKGNIDMRRISWTCFFLSLSLVGCGDDGGTPAGDTGTGSSSGTSGSPTSAPPSTTMPPGDDGDDDDASATASATGSSTGEPPATGDDTGSSTGGDSGSGSGSESGSTGGGAAAGVCVPACREDADCCPLGSIGCPGEDYPNNWTCVEGACQFGGCAETADCTTLIPIGDPECLVVSDIGVCAETCESDDDCPLGSGTTCIGTADDGTMYCTTPVDPCESDDDCNGSGTCDTDSGACVCASADECTDPELAACAM